MLYVALPSEIRDIAVECNCGSAEELAKARLMIERLERKLRLVLEENRVF